MEEGQLRSGRSIAIGGPMGQAEDPAVSQIEKRSDGCCFCEIACCISNYCHMLHNAMTMLQQCVLQKNGLRMDSLPEQPLRRHMPTRKSP